MMPLIYVAATTMPCTPTGARSHRARGNRNSRRLRIRRALWIAPGCVRRVSGKANRFASGFPADVGYSFGDYVKGVVPGGSLPLPVYLFQGVFQTVFMILQVQVMSPFGADPASIERKLRVSFNAGYLPVIHMSDNATFNVTLLANGSNFFHLSSF